MHWNKAYKKVEKIFEFVGKWFSIILTVIVIISWISRVFTWGNSVPFIYIRDNLQSIWLIILTVSAITVWILVSRLNHRFFSGFSDKFDGNLKDNWDFEGPWRIADRNTLLVTGSDAGGLTKVGATWENYTFTFDARIKNTCLGVVVRAQDLSNYYMFQINIDRIRPHRRIAVPLVEENARKSQDANGAPQFNFVKYAVTWQIFDPPTPINPPLDKWFKVKIKVRGESIQIYIDDELQYQQDAFLKISTGKVGFRNSGAESAFVRNIKVIIDQ